MLHPSYSELMNNLNLDSADENKVTSRYTIVIAVAKRARQLTEESVQSPEPLKEKAVSTAVRELYNGEIKIITDVGNDMSLGAVVDNLYSEA